MRETINNDLIAYGIESMDFPEMVDAYLAAYALSMLSRYYPDYWITCLESHCMAAKVIEQFVSLICRKGPLMVLRFLLPDNLDIVISNHRAPWYSH